MITIVRSAAYLEHHGIKGQKWGVKNGPPYPLGYDDHSTSQKRLNPKSELNNYDAKATRFIKEKTAGSSPANVSNSKKNKKQKGWDSLSDEQKEKIKTVLKVGSIAAGTALAAYGAYKVYNNYWQDIYADIDPETGFPLIKGDHSVKDDIMALNPGGVMTPYGMLDAVTGSTANCMLCTTNYELRRRGFDVHAGLSTEGYQNSLLEDIFDGVKIEKPNLNSISELEKYMTDKYPEGARGNFMLYYNSLFGGGHSIVWEIENGKVVLRDGQAKIVSESMQKALKFSDPSTVEFARTDNLPIKADVLKNMGYTRTTNNTKFMVDNMASIPANLVKNNAAELDAMGMTAGAVAYAAYYIKESRSINTRNSSTRKKGKETNRNANASRSTRSS